MGAVLDGGSVVSIRSRITGAWSWGTALAKWRVWAVRLKTVAGVEEETRSRDGNWGARKGCDVCRGQRRP